MPSPLARAIRDHLKQYVEGRITFRAFDAWFVGATMDVDRRGSQSEIDLTYEIYLRLAEYDHGDWTKAQLHEMLRQLADVGLPAPVTT